MVTEKCPNIFGQTTKLNNNQTMQLIFHNNYQITILETKLWLYLFWKKNIVNISL